MDKKGSVNLLSRVFLMISFFIVVFAACSRENYPDDKPDVPKVDTTAPVIKVLHASVDITGVEEITIRTNALYIGELLVATWSDNVTTNCRVSMTINGNNITSGSVPIVSGTLTLTVTDDAGNSTTATIKLTMKETHPDITIYHTEVNVYGGVQLGISYDHLTIDGEQVMAWSDKTTDQCKVTVSQGDKELKDGDMLNVAGMLKVVVTNGQGKSSTGEIELVSNPIEGLENLYAAELQVGRETDLLDGLTFVNGATLIKTEIEQDGTRSTIDDATRFTPELPGQCNIIFTVQGQDGTTTQVVTENLTIKPMEYNEQSVERNQKDDIYDYYSPVLDTVGNVGIKQSFRKERYYPHILLSYAACNHSELPDRVLILQGETSDFVDENINIPTATQHGNSTGRRLRILCPNAHILGNHSSNWTKLESYLNDHPNKFYFISCSAGLGGTQNPEDVVNSGYAASIRRMLENKSIVLTTAIGNKDHRIWQNYNESVVSGGFDASYYDHEPGFYNLSSTNSNYKNKIAVIGCVDYDNLELIFSDEATVGQTSIGTTESLLPVGYGKNIGNIALAMFEFTYTVTSSYPTAFACATISNAVSVMMMNNPDITTPADAMEIISDKYFNEDFCKIYGKSTNWQITEAEDCQINYFMIWDFLRNELLLEGKGNDITLNGDDVELPFGRGICYLGKGVQFELDGVRHDISETAALTEALKAGNAKWYWNRRAFRRYGDANSVDLHVYVVDKNGKAFPDLELNITKPVN